MSSHLRRLGAVVVTAALLGAVGLHTASAVISTQQFCANIPTGQSGFTDIDSAAQHRRNVECLKGSGITAGKTATTYAPTEQVSRAQMATFIARMVDLANALDVPGGYAIPDLPSAGAAGDHFTDDENTGGHEANINRLADAEIVSGQTATTYNPTGNVSRAQMATFIAQALDFIRGAPLAEGADRFTDDENTGGHQANINRLANADIVGGQTATTFNPTGFVSRAQMASFVIQAMADLHADGFITVLPPNTQTIVIDPPGAVSNPTDGAAGDEVAFTASNIVVGDVDLALFPCDNVSTGQTPYTFADNPDDGTADPSGELVEADIVSVNGTAQPANTEFVSGVAVTNGSITFTVDSPAPDCVVAVVWDDADDDDRLDLAGSNQPTESFGGSGQVTFVPPDATTGAMDEDVFSTNRSGDSFIGCEIGASQGPPGAGDNFPEQGPNAVNLNECFTFHYDANDIYFIDANDNLMGDAPAEQVSQAVFEAALSPGDDVSGNYNADAGSQSRFVLTDEAPTAPGGVTAASAGGTITVTFNEVFGVDSYRVHRNQTNNPQPCPSFSAAAYTLAGSVPGGAADADEGTTNSFTDQGLAANTRYCYVVTSVDEGDEGPASSSANATTGADTVPPVAIDTRSTVNPAPDDAEFGNGDEFQVCFNEDIDNPVDALPGGDTERVQLRDGDGSSTTLTQGAGVSFTRGATTIVVQGADNQPCAANRVLNVRVTGFPTVTGGNGVLGYNSLDVIDASEIEDTAMNFWVPSAAGNTDVRIDNV